MLGPLPARCWQQDPATTALLTRCFLALRAAAPGVDGRIGKGRGEKEKKGDFFVEENKYGDMETDPSANRGGLRFDRAAGSQVAVSVPRN